MTTWKRIAEGDYETPDGRYRMYRLCDVHPPAWNVEDVTFDGATADATTDGLIVDGAATMRDAKALFEQHREPPRTPVPGVTFHDLREGDRVTVTLSGRTGTIVRRCTPRRDGWIVRWDEPVFGVTEGRVAWANLEPAS